MSYTRPLFITSLFLIAVAPFASAEQSMLARVTVYWASGGAGSDSATRAHIASSGARLQAGHCAVDPRLIPYGSKVILPDASLVAVDTGSAVRSRRAARLAGRSALEKNAIVIDRFFETKDQAMAWANRNPQFMTVKVQTPNESLNGTRTRVAPKSAALSKPKAPPTQNKPPVVVADNSSQSHYGRRVGYLP